MNQTVQQLRAHIEHDLYAPYSMKKLAEEFNISAAVLNARFKKAYGVTVPAYIRVRRMEEAAALLAQGELPVTRIAVMVGYVNPSKFSQAFKKTHGMTPSEYRRQACLKKRANKTHR